MVLCRFRHLDGQTGFWSADPVKIRPRGNTAAPAPEVEMVQWLLEVLGLSSFEPPIENEAGYVLIVDG